MEAITSPEPYSFMELRQIVLFIRKQTTKPIKAYVNERASELGEPLEVSFHDLYLSAMDLYIDRVNPERI
jgi:hypothetical protein